MTRHISLRTQAALAVLLSLLQPRPSSAESSARYALIVGNNLGNSSRMKVEKLSHAERDARRVYRSLVKHGNFSARRVVLLTGSSRKTILRAADRLAALHRRERAMLGGSPTLFAIYFTGHGLDGTLLTPDQPLTGEDLARIVRKMGATLTVGFFDACFSGSIDLNTLRAKGAIRTPGYNPVVELPREMLTSEGLMWFVSSKPTELSYEDKKLGGLFTHYFIKGLTRAQQDGIGVSLASVWEYTRRRTQVHAARYGRNQTPEKIVQTLKSRGPIYLSYNRKRTATLVFQKEVKGKFLLRYDKGGLVEVVKKEAGKQRKVAIYEGKVSLSEVTGGRAARTVQLKVKRGGAIFVRRRGVKASHGPWYGEAPIKGKGGEEGLPDLTIATQKPAPLFTAGVGYRFALNRQDVVSAAHAMSVGGNLYWGSLSLGLDLSFGTDSGDYSAWSYRINAYEPRLLVGYGVDLGAGRLDIEAGGGVTYCDLDYRGVGQSAVGGWLGGSVAALLPYPWREPWIIGRARVGLGARIARGIVISDSSVYVTAEPIFEGGLIFPL